MKQGTRGKLPRAAFEKLVREHHAAVYASALRITRENETALDVTQEVYLALLEGRIELSGTEDERVLRWFAIRRSLQKNRERASRRRREEDYAMNQPEARSDTGVLDADTALALERFIARLPDELRSALQLRFHEGLTFARVGEALEISEPAAHERVKRALERLKDSLSRAGLAAVAVDVERALEAPSVPAPVPIALAKQLLALHSAVAPVSIAAAILGSMTVIAALVLVVPRLLEHEGEERVAVVSMPVPAAAASTTTRSLDVPDAAQRREPARPFGIEAAASNSMVPIPEPVETKGTLVGRVTDADGLPVSDLVIVANSIERDGKFARYTSRGKTGGDGRFRIECTVGVAGATNYTLAIEGRVAFEASSPADLLRVESGATRDVGVLRLAPRALDEDGQFELSLKISDENGRAIAGIHAALFRAVRSEDGWSDRTWEASSKFDSEGRAHLSGEHVGRKILVVDGRELGFQRFERDLELGVGAHELAVTLARGLEIRGRLVDVDGHAIVRETGESRFGNVLQLRALDPRRPTDWIFSEIADDGAFLFRGLDPGPHQLEISGGPWSSICMDGVRAGATDVLITLKLHDDPRDRGNHCAEIHGRVVDETTHQPVAVDVMEIDVEKLDPETRRAGFDVDLAPAFLFPPPVQVAWSGEYPSRSDRVHTGSLGPGAYALIVRNEGYAPEFVGPIELAAHEMRSDLVVSLVRPTRVTGSVLDADGRPCPDAFVLVNGIGPKSLERRSATDADVVRTNGNPRAAVWELARTDANGAFSIEGLSPRYDYVLEAFHARFEPITSARVEGRDPGAVGLRFEKKR